MGDEPNQPFDPESFLQALGQPAAIDPHDVPADLTAGLSPAQLAAYERWTAAEDRLAEFDETPKGAPRSARAVWSEEKRKAYRMALDDAENAKHDLVAKIRAAAAGRPDPSSEA